MQFLDQFRRHGVGLCYALCVRERWKKRGDNIKKSDKIPKWRMLTTSFDGMGHISFNLIPRFLSRKGEREELGKITILRGCSETKTTLFGITVHYYGNLHTRHTDMRALCSLCGVIKILFPDTLLIQC